MADQNKDETKPIASGLQPGPTEHLAVTSPQAKTAAGASSTGSTSGNMTSKATQAVKENTARLTEEAKHYAGDMANMAKEKSRTVFQQQKETAVGKVDSFAQAFRTTAQQLQGDQQQAQIGHYIEMAADKLESFSNQLRQKDLDTLISDTQNLARRSPAAFFAGTVVAGFLLSRFLKSSSERMRDSMDSSYDRQNAFSDMNTGTGTYTTQSSAAGSESADVASAYRTSATSTDTSRNSTTGTTGTGSTAGTAQGTSGTGMSSSTLSSSSTTGDTHGTR